MTKNNKICTTVQNKAFNVTGNKVNCIGQTQQEIDDAKYVVTIIWGMDGDTKETFGFSDILSYHAFLLGVDAACGWMEYEVEEEPYYHADPFEPDHPKKLNWTMEDEPNDD